MDIAAYNILLGYKETMNDIGCIQMSTIPYVVHYSGLEVHSKLSTMHLESSEICYASFCGKFIE